MRIIEILKLDNGAHNNQTSDFLKEVPSGWAVVPVNLETPNFPFGELEVEEINGVPTVTKWIPLPIPEPEPVPEEPTEMERLRADIDYIMAMEGLL